MVTYRLLVEARPGAWRDAAAGWRRFAAALAARAQAIGRVRRQVAAQWHGPAAAAALAALDRLVTALGATRTPALECDQALCEHASEIDRIQRRLSALVSAPGSPLVRVDAEGAVRLETATTHPDPFDLAAARRTAAGIATLVACAARSDERAGARLRAAAAEVTAAQPAQGPAAGGGPGAVPVPAGASPGQVRRWWDALSAAGRAWLLAHDPRALGALDGLPVAVRDAANRSVLDGLIGSAAGPHRRALRELAARLANAEPARAYLIALDPAGDGRAVVSVGDPDRAAHVLTFVPGAGSDLGDLGGLLARTDRLAASANAGTAPASGPAAAVLWLGYDAPEWLGAAGVAAAERGARDLDRFQEGLRVSAAGPPAHHTVLGHSYGSLVVGVAARDHGLAAHDLVFVGSPGTGVDRAAELGLAPEHVWASTARFDVIRATALADRRLEGFDGAVDADRWHGTNPGDPRFGGRTFTSDPGSWTNPLAAHLSYLDPGTRSLATIGAIARADYAAAD